MWLMCMFRITIARLDFNFPVACEVSVRRRLACELRFYEAARANPTKSGVT